MNSNTLILLAVVGAAVALFLRARRDPFAVGVVAGGGLSPLQASDALRAQQAHANVAFLSAAAGQAAARGDYAEQARLLSMVGRV